MNSLLRLMLGLAVIGVLLAVVGRFAAPCLLKDLGMDWWNVAEQYRQHRAELARAEDLARRDGVLADRISTKSAVTQRLIAGEITLMEAAACFGELNDMPSDCPSGYRNFFPGAPTARNCVVRSLPGCGASWVRIAGATN